MSREIQNNLTENESQKGQDAYGEGGALTQAKLEAQDSASSLSKYGMHGVGFKLEDNKLGSSFNCEYLSEESLDRPPPYRCASVPQSKVCIFLDSAIATQAMNVPIAPEV